MICKNNYAGVRCFTFVMLTAVVSSVNLGMADEPESYYVDPSLSLEQIVEIETTNFESDFERSYKEKHGIGKTTSKSRRYPTLAVVLGDSSQLDLLRSLHLYELDSRYPDFLVDIAKEYGDSDELGELVGSILQNRYQAHLDRRGGYATHLEQLTGVSQKKRLQQIWKLVEIEHGLSNDVAIQIADEDKGLVDALSTALVRRFGAEALGSPIVAKSYAIDESVVTAIRKRTFQVYEALSGRTDLLDVSKDPNGLLMRAEVLRISELDRPQIERFLRDCEIVKGGESIPSAIQRMPKAGRQKYEELLILKGVL